MAGLVAKLAAPFRKFSIGFGAGNFRDARIGIADIGKQAEGSGSKMADLGVKAGNAITGLRGHMKSFADTSAEASRQTAGLADTYKGLTSLSGAGQGPLQTDRLRKDLRQTVTDSTGFQNRMKAILNNVRFEFGQGLGKAPDVMAKGWQKIGGAAGAAAGATALAVTAISGYMAGLTEDTATQVISYTAVVGEIAAAWMEGGPILGAIATGTALIGIYFGNAAKQAEKEAAFLKDFEDAAKRAGTSYADALGEFGTSDQGKMAASWKVINTAIEDTEGKLQGIKDDLRDHVR